MTLCYSKTRLQFTQRDVSTICYRGALLVRPDVPDVSFRVVVPRIVPVLDTRPDSSVGEEDCEEDEQVLVHAPIVRRDKNQ